MDYEKKYKEAFERAKKLYEEAILLQLEQDIKDYEYIFPELKEREDEKIKKALIHLINEQDSFLTAVNGISVEDILAWLEKQGESKFEQCTQEGDKIVTNEDGTHFNVSQFERVTKKESQVYETENGEVSEGYKVIEPKFHEGDWIVDSQGLIYQIERIVENVTTHTFGYDIVGGGYFNDDNEGVHIWTIKDAKHGDVLVYDEEILLFKSCSIQGRISLYCWYNRQMNNFHDKELFDILLTKRNKIYPATKEQCDFLFQKMKEAGYTFDFEKKELKKIEIITPLFNVGDTIIKKHNSDIHDFGSFTITDITGGKYWYNDRIICDITEQDEWELYKPIRQNPAWSEEDEETLNRIRTIVRNDNSSRVEDILWLKSLKGRVQTKWKPSEEQIQALEYQVHSTYKGSWQYKASKELLEQLKKL